MIGRRNLLRLLGGTALLASTPATASAMSSDQSDGPIPAPFDAIPVTEEPTEKERESARLFYPPRAVPEEGPIPDIMHSHTPTRTIVAPEWAIESVIWRLGGRDEPITRATVEEFLFDYAHVSEEFVTADGRDAVDVVLEEVDSER